MAKKNEEVAAQRGRQPSFPDQETVAVLFHVPCDTRANLRALAAHRGEPMNVIVDRLINQAHNRISKKAA